MKYLYLLFTLALLSVISSQLKAQTVLIDHNFQVTALPAGVTSDGIVSPTKAADGVCSKGMIQVNSGGFMQVDVASNGVFKVNMKSTSSSTRLLTVKSKKDGEATYTTVTTSLAVSVAAAYDLTALYPSLVSTVPISVRIEPTNGNIQIHDLYVEASATQSNAAEILSFKIPGQTGNETINSAAGTIAINVPMGTPLTSIVPQNVVLSPQATINPSATTAQNFTTPFNYIVTAQDGTTTKNWTVTVTQVASTAKEIIAFKLSNNQLGDAVIDNPNGTIIVYMPTGSDVSNVVPVALTISANATVNPNASTAQNFTTPVVYTVTAQDNSTKTFTVNVSLVDPNTFFTDYQAEDAEFTGTVDSNNSNYTGAGFVNFLSADNYIIYTVCERQAGDQTAKFRYSLGNDTDRKGKLYVNDIFVKVLNFPRTTSFSDWLEETATVNLVAGINKIKITWDSTDGPNIDKLSISGVQCSSYNLNVSATNGGTVTISPNRTNNKYFEGESVTLLANVQPAIQFNNWTGDLTGNTNPATLVMNSNKTIVANFTTIATYKLNTTVVGIGEIILSPAGGEYAAGTVVTLTAKFVLGSTFTGWSGDLSGTTSPTTITMNSVKNVTATFSSNYSFNFDKVIGFASAPGDGFAGPTTGGQCASDTLTINGPSEFNKLAESLYYRQQAYRNRSTNNGMKYAPLVIMLKAGTYDGSQTLSTNGGKAFANSMLDIAEQGDLTFMGESGVVFKIGINVKRSYNVIIRNIFFRDYYDDGVNIGGTETHHIWVDHCTFGDPLNLPTDSEHPDGGCDVKDGASYVTISWSVFRNSWKTSLTGHSDNNGATDVGRLKVTYANNHFLGTNSRNPRVRFGEVHVLNNLSERVALYGIAAANSAWVYAENNFYLNTDWPMYADRSVADFKAVYGNNSDGVYTSKTGNYPALGLKQVGNEYDDSGLPIITSQINPAMLNPGGRSIKFDELNAGAIFNPSSYYSYTPLTASEVRTIIPLYAGADKVNFTSNCSSVLPVKLVSFNAVLSADKKSVSTTWRTSNEINAKGFEVERSVNGNAFNSIGFVKAKNVASISDYFFVDGNAVDGTSFYRLKQIDNDGRFTYSNIVKIESKTSLRLSVFPNPSSSTITITHSKSSGDGFVKITNVEGRLLLTVKVSLGVSQTRIDVSKFAAGNYLVVFDDRFEKQTTKFMKNK